MRFARGDEQELPSYEQDDYVREAGASARSVQELLSEFEAVRKATLALFGSLPAGVETRRGVANGISGDRPRVGVYCCGSRAATLRVAEDTARREVVES